MNSAVTVKYTHDIIYSERPEESSPPSLPYSSFSSPPLRALENLIPRRSLELQESLPTCSFIMSPPPSYSDAFVNQDMELKGEQDTRPLPVMLVLYSTDKISSIVSIVSSLPRGSSNGSSNLCQSVMIISLGILGSVM